MIFEVVMVAYRVVLVEANSDNEAVEIAEEETSFGELELDEIKSVELTDPKYVERMKRHMPLLRS